jgi:hypothetical protein
VRQVQRHFPAICAPAKIRFALVRNSMWLAAIAILEDDTPRTPPSRKHWPIVQLATTCDAATRRGSETLASQERQLRRAAFAFKARSLQPTCHPTVCHGLDVAKQLAVLPSDSALEPLEICYGSITSCIAFPPALRACWSSRHAFAPPNPRDADASMADPQSPASCLWNQATLI